LWVQGSTFNVGKTLVLRFIQNYFFFEALNALSISSVRSALSSA
jgi:hypothetical protein